jgi:hypothetical protein
MPNSGDEQLKRDLQAAFLRKLRDETFRRKIDSMNDNESMPQFAEAVASELADEAFRVLTEAHR